LESAVFVIDRLGHLGDGVAVNDGQTIYIDGALPGETVEAERIGPDRARLQRIVAPSPERTLPPCPHFGICGGCMAQHMADRLYRNWKEESVRVALAQQGIETRIEPLFPVAPRTRRRVKLAFTRKAGKPVLGFHAARSHDVVALRACPVMREPLEAVLPRLADLLAPLCPAKGEIAVTVMETVAGLDIAVEAKRIDRPLASRLFAAAGAAGLARLAIGAENVTYRPPLLGSKTPRHTPPGGFAQAVGAVEEGIAGLASEALKSSKRVLELFCGSGAITFELARHSSVHAVEGDEAALGALSETLRHLQGVKPVTVEKRDLFRRPFAAFDIDKFDAALLDPPRQGAQAQVKMLAASKLAKLVYVSCAPSTLARDARLLIDGGFRLSRIVPLDQFLWSPHVELFAVFDRPPVSGR